MSLKFLIIVNKLLLSQQRNDASTVWQFAQLQQYRFSIINVTRHYLFKFKKKGKP